MRGPRSCQYGRDRNPARRPAPGGPVGKSRTARICVALGVLRRPSVRRRWTDRVAVIGDRNEPLGDREPPPRLATRAEVAAHRHAGRDGRFGAGPYYAAAVYLSRSLCFRLEGSVFPARAPAPRRAAAAGRGAGFRPCGSGGGPGAGCVPRAGRPGAAGRDGADAGRDARTSTLPRNAIEALGPAPAVGAGTAEVQTGSKHPALPRPDNSFQGQSKMFAPGGWPLRSDPARAGARGPPMADRAARPRPLDSARSGRRVGQRPRSGGAGPSAVVDRRGPERRTRPTAAPRPGRTVANRGPGGRG